MSKLITETVQSGDWKNEKHVPELEIQRDGDVLKIKAEVGSEIEHPNTFEHHIAWLKVYFQPEGGNFPVEVASYEAAAHGEGELFTVPCVKAAVKGADKGTVYAVSYCNIHGLWQNSEDVQ